MFSRVIGALALLVLGSSTSAMTLTATGAMDIDVDGTLYDVFFTDGSCLSVFDGCDSASGFTFTTQQNALAASQALLGLIASTSSIDDQPDLMEGCDWASYCNILTPYGISGGSVPYNGIRNWNSASTSQDGRMR